MISRSNANDFRNNLKQKMLGISKHKPAFACIYEYRTYKLTFYTPKGLLILQGSHIFSNKNVNTSHRK